MPYSEWLPPQRHPKALMIALHGLSGAASDFQPLGEFLVSKGMALQAPELRGQGNDPVRERRGDLQDESVLKRDILEFFQNCRERFPRSPIYVLGESLGATLLVHYLADLPEAAEAPAGAIFMVPVTSFRKPPNETYMKIFKALHYVSPGMKIPLKYFVSRGGKKQMPLCRDPEFLKQMDGTTHRIQKFSLRFLKMVHGLISQANEKAKSVHCPAIVLHSGKDLFTTPEQTRTFLQAIRSEDKGEGFWADAAHLLLRDPHSYSVMEFATGWIELRVPAEVAQY